MKKLAIISTHPVQYYAPVFQLLSSRKQIDIKVFYTLGEPGQNKYDPGFKRHVQWDIPLLTGYAYEWLENTAFRPASDHFLGVVNPDIISKISSYQPDALLIFGWSYHSHLQCLRYFKGRIPVYFRGDSTLLDASSSLKKVARKLLLKWVYHFVDHVFYVGTNNKSYYEEFGLHHTQLSLAPHAVDNQRFGCNRKEEAEALRARLQLGQHDQLILFAGKLEPKKAPQLLMEAFLTLQQDNLHLLFAGNGALEKQLKTMATNAKNVHFLDFQNQQFMPVLYQAADLFCLPSQGPAETWGLAVNEAMASGLPVIVSDKVGCAIDLVSPRNGAIFISGDLKALMAAIIKLTAKNEHLKELGYESKKIIKPWNFFNIALAVEQKLLTEKNDRFKFMLTSI